MTHNVALRLAILVGIMLFPGVALAQDAAAAAAQSRDDSAGRVTTADRARQALQVAKLAATNGMQDLSLRAVRESLAGGPPVQAVEILGNQSRVSRPEENDPYREFIDEMEQTLADLSLLWEEHAFDPPAVYEVLAVVVLPTGRPNEVFLYPKSLTTNDRSQPGARRTAIGLDGRPRTVSGLLVQWAERADTLDELEQRVAARGEQPRAKIEALCLLTQIALAKGDTQLTNERLKALAAALGYNSLQHSAEMACHVALPAMANPKTAQTAMPLVEQVVHTLSSTATVNYQMEPASTLLLQLARARFEAGDAERADQHLNRYLEINQANNSRYSGDYGLNLRQQQLTKVAEELMRGGRIADAFARFGEAADITTQYRSSNVSSSHVVKIARVLARQPAAERYQTLYDWTMPKPGRQMVRVMTGFVPYEVPPAVFARLADPEHPAPEHAFDVPTFGLAGNVVSTAAILVDTAQQTGKLDSLIGELLPHAEQGVENADVVLTLALLADGRTDEAETFAAPRTAELAEARKERDRGRDAMADFLVALACVGHKQTADAGHELLDEIIPYAKSLSNYDLIKQARHVQARSLSRSAAPDVVQNARPALWTHATVTQRKVIEAGAPPPTWIAHAGNIHHTSGVEGDTLFFRYPLAGEFEFSVDAVNADWADGDLSYGGAVFQLRGRGDQAHLTDVGFADTVTIRHQVAARDSFVRRTIKVGPQSTTFAASGVTLFTDEHPPSSSPWVALASHGNMETTYRNFEIRGEPTIPREVRLSDDPHMRGWVCRYYSERRPAAIKQPEDDAGTTGSGRTEEPNWDWWWEDGVIHGVRTIVIGGGSALPSRLLYHRPLESGDRISWEFFYAHGREAVHPTLGRLAFLIAQDGIRLHWMTTGEEDWTRLPLDNAVSDPASERGNIAGVLREGWNDAVLALHGDTVALTLNGEPVFERTLEGHASRQFGLFHFNDRSKARARNIVLTGDWPERLDEHTLARLTEPVRSDFPKTDGHALHAIIDEEHMIADSIDVVQRARAQPAEKRYEFLANWVLPGRDHPTLRTVADATPAHPSPPVMQTSSVRPTPSVSSVDDTGEATAHETGGALVSPLWELIDVAQELGRLGELRGRVADLEADDNLSRRSQLAALCLIDLSAGEAASAEEALKELRNELDQMQEFDNWQRWPEVVAAARAIDNLRTLPVALDVLEYIVAQQIEADEQPGERRWNRHVYALRGRAQRRAALLEAPGSLSPVTAWAPVVHPRSRMRGNGFPMPVWRTTPEGELRHWPGCDDDYLYFPVPLDGDFVLESEITSAKGREMHVGYAGHWFGLDSSREQYRACTIARSPVTHTLDPPIESQGDWDRYQLVVTGETCTTFVNDREIGEQSLPRDRDPWLVIHCDHHSSGSVRNVRIAGDPAVPKSLNLLLDDQLTGWSARYFEQSIGPVDQSRSRGEEKFDWHREDDTLIGQLNPQFKDVPAESLLQYHRPLLEDGVLRYRFRYAPEKELVHPALDRLVFLLDPEQGVRIHWLTDGKFDRTPLGPNNVFDEPQNRIAAPLPLRSGEFNELRLELAGDNVDLFLNDQPIFRRELNAANSRLFGLFHDRSQTEARVRDIEYTGQWSTTLPEDIRVARGSSDVE